eukprot:SAG31_NODE_634_length_13365_cov_182.161767_4_plen_123_part_00
MAFFAATTICVYGNQNETAHVACRSVWSNIKFSLQIHGERAPHSSLFKSISVRIHFRERCDDLKSKHIGIVKGQQQEQQQRLDRSVRTLRPSLKFASRAASRSTGLTVNPSAAVDPIFISIL